MHLSTFLAAGITAITLSIGASAGKFTLVDTTFGCALKIENSCDCSWQVTLNKIYGCDQLSEDVKVNVCDGTSTVQFKNKGYYAGYDRRDGKIGRAHV